MSRKPENHREDVIGRANVEDTPELLAYYEELDRHHASRPVDGREPDRAVGARVGVRSGRLALLGPARPRPSLHRARDPGGGGTAGRLPQQSRPHGRGGGGRLDLRRAAGDEPRRGGERASAFGLRDPLHHGGRGSLHGRRRAQDDPRRERLRADPERDLARARGRGDRQSVHLAGRPRHSLRQRDGRELLRGAPGTPAGRRLRSRRHDQDVGQRRPDAERRRVDPELFADVQVRMAGDLRGLARVRRMHRGLALRRRADGVREPGHQRAGDADDGRQHADAAGRRAHEGAPPHRKLPLSRHSGKRPFDHRWPAIRLVGARHLLRAFLDLA